MTNVIIGVLVGGIAMYGLCKLRETVEVNELRDRIESLKKSLECQREFSKFWECECEDLVESSNSLRQELLRFKSAYYELAKHKSAEQASLSDEDVLDAIKFAMKNSHPDKPNGNAEDFRKFHSLYKRHCK